MKYCGVVTDISWYEPEARVPFLDVAYTDAEMFPLKDRLTINWEARRIYADEVPMADEKTIGQFGYNKYLVRCAKRTIEYQAAALFKMAF